MEPEGAASSMSTSTYLESLCNSISVASSLGATSAGALASTRLRSFLGASYTLPLSVDSSISLLTACAVSEMVRNALVFPIFVLLSEMVSAAPLAVLPISRFKCSTQFE